VSSEQAADKREGGVELTRVTDLSGSLQAAEVKRLRARVPYQALLLEHRAIATEGDGRSPGSALSVGSVPYPQTYEKTRRGLSELA